MGINIKISGSTIKGKTEILNKTKAEIHDGINGIDLNIQESEFADGVALLNNSQIKEKKRNMDKDSGKTTKNKLLHHIWNFIQGVFASLVANLFSKL